MKLNSGYAVLAMLLAFSASAEPRVTLPQCAQSPAIDGSLDDACWTSAAAITEFVQIRPGDNTAPSRETTVLLARDADALYVAVRAADDPALVRATVSRRDDVLADDHVTLYLDTFDDRRRAYVIALNPLGIQQDGIYAEGRAIDYSLDLVFRSQGRLTRDGYTIEAAIPFSSLRYRSGAGRRWGLHVERTILHLDEELSWTPRKRGNANLLDQAGSLTGLDQLGGARTLEVIPGITVADGGDPSLTAKLALASDLVIDATVRPDFAQIEADQLVSTANQRFPIFFAEKRPFFLEGIDAFQTPLNAFHSRTILDPETALKATGRRGQTTFAVLAASDDRLERRSATAGVLRLRRDIGEQSFLGAIATSFDSDDRRGRVAGIDGRITLDAQTAVSFQLLGTQTESNHGLGFFAEWKRSGRHVSVTVQGEGRTPHYRADLGFTTQTDTHRWSILTRYDSEPDPAARVLISWSALHTALAQWDWDGRLEYAYLYPRVQLDFRRRTRLTLFAYADYLRLFAEDFGGAFAGPPSRDTIYKGAVVDLQTAPLKTIALGLTVDHAWDFFDYDFGAPPRFARVSPAALLDPHAPPDPGTGRSLNVTARIDWQPLDVLRVTVDHTRARLVRDDTERVAFDERLWSVQAAYQFTTFTFARVRADYDWMRNRTRGQLLAGWTPLPGTALYAGVTDDGEERTLFLKASYLVRRSW